MLLLVACEYEKVEFGSQKDFVSYANDVVPILSRKCTLSGCHIPGATTGDFTSYTELKTKINLGIFQQTVFNLRLMPPVTNPPLEDEELNTLRRWVEQGSPEN